MFRTLCNIFSKRYGRFWLTVSAGAVIALYLGVIPYAARKGGDFVHLWIGGHLVAQAAAAQLYTPDAHRAILEANQLPLQTYWGARYEILGVFFYPPLTGLLYAPLGALSLYWAQAAQAVVNIGLGMGAAWLLTQIINRRLSFGVVLLLLFTFPSFFFAYALGQNGILTTTLVLASWYLLKTQRAWWAGIVLSTLTYKPNWFLAIGWIPLGQRWWRVLLGITSGLLLLLLVTVSTLGIASLQAYLAVFTKLADLHDLPNYPLAIQYSILSLFRRYLGMNTAATLLGWGVALSIVLVTVRYTRYRIDLHRIDLHWASNAVEQRQFLLSTALAWVAAVCLNPHLHHYDLILIGVAMIMALSEWQELSHRQRIYLSGLLAFNHLAFLMSNQWGLDTTLPLPIFAMLAVWGWLLWRVQAVHRQLTATMTPDPWRAPLYVGPETQQKVVA